MSSQESTPPFGFEHPHEWADSHCALSALLDCSSFCIPQLSRIGLRWDKAANQPWAEIEWPRNMRIPKQSAPLGCERSLWGHHLDIATQSWLPGQPELAAFLSHSLFDTLELAHMPTDWAPSHIGLAQSLLWDDRYPNGIDRQSPEGLESAESAFLSAFDIAPEFTLRAVRFGLGQSTGAVCQTLLSELELQAVDYSASPASPSMPSGKSGPRL